MRKPVRGASTGLFVIATLVALALAAPAAAQEPVTIAARLLPAAEGQPARLQVEAEIAASYHVYAIAQPPGGPLATKIKLDPNGLVQLAGPFEPTTAPHKGTEEAFPGVTILSHEGTVVWTAPLEFAPGVDASQVAIEGSAAGQACNEGGCIQWRQKFSIPAAKPKPASIGSFQAEGKHTKLEGYVEPSTVKPGQPLRLVISATPDAHHHLYALAASPKATGPQAALIKVYWPEGWKVGAPQPSSSPDGETEGVPHHSQAVTWTIEIVPPADAKPGEAVIAGLVGYQSCSEQACDPPLAARFTAVVGTATAAKQARIPLSFTAASYKAAAEAIEPKSASSATPRAPGIAPGALPAGPAGEGPAGEGPVDASLAIDPSRINPRVVNEQPVSLAGVLALAFVGGMLLNLMPCVLPVIGLKILSFMQQGGESRWRVFSLNLWYSAGLLAVFLVLAWLAISFGYGWGALNTKPSYIITMTAVVFAMALSFLGVWEIPIPGFAAGSSAQELSNKEGPAGAFSKGVITTLLATPCTGPFMGSALAWAVGRPSTVVLSVFVAIGLGMASPYLVIGAFPKLIKWLPKPGPWMDTFKQLMGFLLLGTVVWLLYSVPAPMLVPTVALLFGLWMALWWFGRVPLYAEFGERVKAWAGAIAIGVVAYTIPFKVLSAKSEHELAWQPFSLQALGELSASGKTVIVDFTAEWCATCKVLEKGVLNTERTLNFVEANGIVAMKADMTHHEPEDDSDENRLLQAVARTKQIPVLAIFPAGRPYDPIVFNGPYTRSQLLAELERAGPSKSGPTGTPEVRQARVE